MTHRRLPIFLLMASLAGFLAACTSADPADFEKAAAADEAFRADIESLKGRRILFGHQSVGRNVMEGLHDLLAEAKIEGFPVTDLDKRALETVPATGLLHIRAGANGNPDGKCDAFARQLSDTAARYDAALLKFCYVDIKAATDVDKVLAHYVETVKALKARHTGTVFVHVTVPLKSGTAGLKLKVKRLIGREDYPDADNARRGEYNRKLLAAFPGEPVFDLAAVESTYPDGSRETFERAGATWHSLIPALTYDEGHLGSAGRRLAAKALVRTLAGALGPARR